MSQPIYEPCRRRLKPAYIRRSWADGVGAVHRQSAVGRPPLRSPLLRQRSEDGGRYLWGHLGEPIRGRPRHRFGVSEMVQVIRSALCAIGPCFDTPVQGRCGAQFLGLVERRFSAPAYDLPRRCRRLPSSLAEGHREAARSGLYGSWRQRHARTGRASTHCHRKKRRTTNLQTSELDGTDDPEIGSEG
jgi:hypothetical protein